MKKHVSRSTHSILGTRKVAWKPDTRLYTIGLTALVFVFSVGALSILFFHLPETPQAGLEPFPVGVDARTKTIEENPLAEAMLPSTGLKATALYAEEGLQRLIGSAAETSAYQLLAAAGAPSVAVVHSGFRKEEVVRSFDQTLSWGADEENAFLAAGEYDAEFLEGIFPAGLYTVSEGTTPEEVRALVDRRFAVQILDRYGTSTEEKVPLKDALVIASLIQREAGSVGEMRMISGIIWNRLFSNMKLQVDATVQYAKASESKRRVNWWPVMYPRDKYIKSPYNTYLEEGLPPGPIASPSVAAVIAALNPKKTDCYFYFHDADGDFHCSPTYEEHVAALKKEYGRGK